MELANCGALLLLVLGMAYSGLVLSQRYYRQSEVSVRVQQQAVLAIRRLVGDLGGTPGAGFRSGNDGLVFVTARSTGGTVTYDSSSGRPLWRGLVCYYVSAGDLLRKQRGLTPSPTLPDPMPALADLRDDPTLPAEVVARGVQALQVVRTAPLTFRVRTVCPDFGGGAMELTGTVSFRF